MSPDYPRTAANPGRTQGNALAGTGDSEAGILIDIYESDALLKTARFADAASPTIVHFPAERMNSVRRTSSDGKLRCAR